MPSKLIHERKMQRLRKQYAAKRAASLRQVNGNHYKNFKMQPAEFIHKNGIGFLEGNVIKYVCRHRAKHGRKGYVDLEKARHYIDLLLEWEYGRG